MDRNILIIVAVLGLSAFHGAAQTAEEIAKSLQDPLGNIRALVTDNAVQFRTGRPGTASYNFQLQPVWAIPLEKLNIVPRGVIPILGVPNGAKLPEFGPPVGSLGGTSWGISDITLQLFVGPKSKEGWGYGVGPQISLRTRTSANVAGAGWGGGAALVGVGEVGNFSLSLIASQHWGQDGFNLLSMQPMVYYNILAWPGATLHYNNTITYDWNIESGAAWSVPLGLAFSKSFVVGQGHGLDLVLGYYNYVSRPTNGPRDELRFGISWVLPPKVSKTPSSDK